MIANLARVQRWALPLAVCVVVASCTADEPSSADAAGTSGASAASSPAAGAEPHAGGESALDEVIAAERAFSATSVEHGMRDAFLANFAPDVVTFGPHPVVGTRELEAGPPGPHLEWWPAVAEVSAAGDLGYTTGPYRAPGPAGGEAWGHYHSVWGRTGDGGWHVLLDVGGPHGPVPVPDSVRRPAPPVGVERSAVLAGGIADRTSEVDGDTAPAMDTLLAADRAFDAAAAGDPDAALRDWALPRSRFYRFGQTPLEGVAAAVRDRRTREEQLRWEPVGGGVSSSADLGYTWGTGTTTSTDTGGEPRDMSYARVWRRTQEGWRVVLEVVLPHPPTGAVDPDFGAGTEPT